MTRDNVIKWSNGKEGNYKRFLGHRGNATITRRRDCRELVEKEWKKGITLSETKILMPQCLALIPMLG